MPWMRFWRKLSREKFEKTTIITNIDKIIPTMKTDLAKVLSVSGYGGLYLYVNQARNGMIAESLTDGKRSLFGMNARISTLEDISIYAGDGELKLSEVFGKLHEKLGDQPAPSSKADPQQIKALFDEAVPDYDSDRFHLSHMKKVVDWYNCLKEHASLDFMTDEDREKEAQKK